MGKYTALSLAGVLSAAAFGPALAADLLPPPPVVEAPIVAPAADMSGWYLRGDVGVGINQMSSLRSTLQPTNALGGGAPAISTAYADLGDSALIGIGAGYQFNNWFRADVTAEYRSSAAYRKGVTYTAFCANPFCLDTYSANVSSAAFMLNVTLALGGIAQTMTEWVSSFGLSPSGLLIALFAIVPSPLFDGAAAAAASLVTP